MIHILHILTTITYILPCTIRPTAGLIKKERAKKRKKKRKTTLLSMSWRIFVTSSNLKLINKFSCRWNQIA